MLLAYNEYRLKMLLDILQCQGQDPHPTTKNNLAQNITSAEVEKLWST